MGEIEVGEYVRTNLGIIYEYTEDEKNDLQMRDFRLCNDGEIVKYSKQLIDLIEVGDCVNGKYVQNIKSDRNGKYILVLIGIIEEQDIKTILTKEQYLANCYKVGGNNEI